MSWLYTSLVRTWPSKELSSARSVVIQEEIIDSEQQALLGAGPIQAPSAEIRRFMEMLGFGLYRNIIPFLIDS